MPNHGRSSRARRTPRRGRRRRARARADRASRPLGAAITSVVMRSSHDVRDGTRPPCPPHHSSSPSQHRSRSLRDRRMSRCRPARRTRPRASARPRRWPSPRRRRRRSAGRAERRARRGRPERRPGGSRAPTALPRLRRARGRRCSTSMAIPSTVLTSVTASAPASRAAPRSRRVVGVRAELRPDRALARRAAPSASAVACGRVREQMARRRRGSGSSGSPRPRRRQARRRAQLLRRLLVVVDRAAPDAGDHARAGTLAAREVVAQATRRRPGPAARRCSASPPVTGCSARRRVARPRLGASDFTTTRRARQSGK